MLSPTYDLGRLWRMIVKYPVCLIARLSVGAMLTVGRMGALAQDVEQPPPIPGEELPAGSEVLTAGPVHEAFAKPVTMDAEEPILVPQQPPTNLQEVPPAEQPAGAG